MSNLLFQNDLRLHLRGDVLTDDLSLGIYATDASVYEVMPLAVVAPLDENDVLTALKIAADHRIPVLPRGSATSLGGQTVNAALVLDFTKYLCNVLEINAVARWARVQPGVTIEQLNRQLKPLGLHYAPDPATLNRATFGGVIGNNSSGTKSIIYGKAVDNLYETKVVLAGGTVMNFSEKNRNDFEKGLPENERDLYAGFKKIIEENEADIIARYPKTMRRTQGYNLDEFAGHDRWNLSKLICGSEGTLATILEAKVKLEPLPRHRCLAVVHFHDFLEAIRATEPMLAFQPCAVELVDRSVLDRSRENLSTVPLCFFIEGNPAALLCAEFQGETLEDCLVRARRMVATVQSLGMGYSHPVYTDEKTISAVLTVRKKGLGLVLGKKGDRKALSFIEDAAIPVPHLADYIAEVLAVCEKYGVEVSAYAHASVGVIHVKPFLDLRSKADVDLYKTIAEEAFQLVLKYGGSWSSEHGDGRVRSAFIERFFGEKIYDALREVKRLFDPENRMNPGNIIGAAPIDGHLRYHTGVAETPIATYYHYREDVTVQNHIHLCTGVGECRRLDGGTMCPSFKATLDEVHSTRGRANALRLAMEGHAGFQAKTGGVFTHPAVKEALDLCLSCKACKSECPSNVDLAKLKSEVLQQHYDAHGVPFRDRFVRDSAAWAARLSGKWAPLINAAQRTLMFKKTLELAAGFSSKRRLPGYAKQSFVSWHKAIRGVKNGAATAASKGKVALFADTYLNFHEPVVGQSALRLLEGLGYEVIVADAGCCQRPRISHGFLREAKRDGEQTARRLDRLIQAGYTVVVCEPSCASALTDDLPDLLDDVALGERLRAHVMPVEVFLEKEMKAGRLEDAAFHSPFKSAFLHGHCHQKALYGTGALRYIFSRIEGFRLQEADTGCCGMAGSFGYEKEHYDLSRKVSELALLPALSKLDADTAVIANGFSCRHQIADFAGRRARHWVEVVEVSDKASW